MKYTLSPVVVCLSDLRVWVSRMVLKDPVRVHVRDRAEQLLHHLGEMGGAPRNPAPRKHFLLWTVKPSGCHCTDACGGNSCRRVPNLLLGALPPFSGHHGGLLLGKAALLDDAVVQLLTMADLHDEVVALWPLMHRVELHDVGVVHRREHLDIVDLLHDCMTSCVSVCCIFCYAMDVCDVVYIVGCCLLRRAPRSPSGRP